MFKGAKTKLAQVLLLTFVLCLTGGCDYFKSNVKTSPSGTTCQSCCATDSCNSYCNGCSETKIKSSRKGTKAKNSRMRGAQSYNSKNNNACYVCSDGCCCCYGYGCCVCCSGSSACCCSLDDCCTCYTCNCNCNGCYGTCNNGNCSYKSSPRSGYRRNSYQSTRSRSNNNSCQSNNTCYGCGYCDNNNCNANNNSNNNSQNSSGSANCSKCSNTGGRYQ